MSISKWTKGAIGSSVAAALLSACSAAGTGPVPAANGAGFVAPSVRGNLNTSLSYEGMRPMHPATGKSWMSPNAKNTKVAYYSDSSYGTINAYSFPDGAAMGQITGLKQPQGMCAVPARPQVGNYWVANTNTHQLLEFAPGGTTPIATIKDANQYPVGCSVDPTTGSIAISNIISVGSGPGSVSVFTTPSSSPTNYPVPNFNRAYFIGYDASGNLFVDGQDTSGSFVFAELPKGGSAFQSLTVSGLTVRFPGTVAWDNQKSPHLVVCDQLGSCYQLTESGSSLSVTGTFALSGSGAVVQGTVTRSKFLAPDAFLGTFNWFNYPAGSLYRPIPGANYLGQPTGSVLGLTKN